MDIVMTVLFASVMLYVLKERMVGNIVVTGE
jgi:hypothetical protein